MKHLPLVLAALLPVVVGELLLKTAMNRFGILNLELRTLPHTVWSLATNPLIIAAVAVYAVGTLLWLAALSRLDLSFVYPWSALAYILITLSAHFILHETVSAQRYLGVLVICLGLVIIAKS